MISVTVKTLDSQNHVFSVEEDISVRQFKEQICPTISIPIEQQRLIFRGRVLQDDKKISEYDVANNTVHVVQRPENQNSTANDEPPARPSSQAGRDAGGIFISADDGVGGGGGRNAIFMGAIGLPTFDVEGGPGDDGGHPMRRTGAQIRLMVGNQMLNRASTLLQRLEDDDEALAAAAAAASSSPSYSSASGSTGSGDPDSPESEVAALLNNDSPMEIDDDANSIERVINQVVNVSSAAALLTAFRQVQPGAQGSNSPSAVQQPAGNDSNAPPSVGATTSGATENSNSSPLTATGSATATSSTSQSANNNQNQLASPSRRVEQPRIRELGTALQDYLALQDRLTPFLRYLQDALRQNRLYTEDGETQSTQFVFDTVSSILHLLGHSLHSFSEIMCDFNLPPDDRRLTASTSILVEQSTVVRATIPVAVPAAAMLAGAAASAAGNGVSAANATTGGNNHNTQSQQIPQATASPGMPFATGAPPPNPSAGGNNVSGPFPTGFGGIPGLSISVSAAPGVPLGNFGSISGIPVSIPGFPAGMMQIPAQMNRQWTNPNAPAPNNPTANPPSQQQLPPNTNPLGLGPHPNVQLPGGGMLPPGLQNLGALLGVGGAGGLANLFGGAAGGSLPPGMQNPFMTLQQFQAGVGNNNNNNNSTARNQQQSASNESSTPGSQASATARTATNNTGQVGGSMPMGGSNNGMGAFQNLMRNELNRPQFDPLLPCHTHHSSGRGRSNNNRNRPAEFRRFVNVEEDAAAQNGGNVEGETVEILIDLVRNSQIIDLLQPVLKDVVLNYLMRGRDPKNPAHVKTCAKGLVKKILPFLEKFSSKVGGASESVDVVATYSNIFTGFLTSLMQRVLGQSPGGDGQLKSEVIIAWTDLQKQLIQAFKVCYPNSTNVGLLFVNYIVERCLGSMSIIFKNQLKQKWVDNLKHIETNVDTSASSSLVVYKEPPTTAAVAGVTPIESSASASKASSSGSTVAEKVTVTTPSQPPTAAPLAPNNLITDDVDIDEVLQLPPSMAATPHDDTTPRRCPHSGGAGALGHSNQTDSIASLMRGLPAEWTETIQQDIRRQVEMPPQQAFSPGFNTLFPRKH